MHHEAAVLITMRWIMLLTGFLNPRTNHYTDGSCNSSVSWEMTIMVVFWGTTWVQTVRDWYCWATLTAKQGVFGLEIWPRLGFHPRRYVSSCLPFVWICQKFMMLLWRRGHTCLFLSVALWSWGFRFHVLMRLKFSWYWLRWGFEFCVILRIEFHVILTPTEAPVPCDTDSNWGSSSMWYWLKLRLQFHVILTQTEASVPCNTDSDWGLSSMWYWLLLKVWAPCEVEGLRAVWCWGFEFCVMVEVLSCVMLRFWAPCDVEVLSSMWCWGFEFHEMLRVWVPCDVEVLSCVMLRFWAPWMLRFWVPWDVEGLSSM